MSALQASFARDHETCPGMLRQHLPEGLQQQVDSLHLVDSPGVAEHERCGTRARCIAALVDGEVVLDRDRVSDDDDLAPVEKRLRGDPFAHGGADRDHDVGQIERDAVDERRRRAPISDRPGC